MLKYLFKARFSNGKTYHQTPEDVSLWDEKRSCFYDVLEMEKEARLLDFTLEGNGHTYLVDLTDGHFEIDGAPFYATEEELTGFRIVFFRNHTHSFAVSQERNQEVSHTVVYRFGWQTTNAKGENVQRIIQIN